MIFVRKMKKEDVPYVCEIQAKSFGMLTPDDFDRSIENPSFFYGVAFSDRTLVGYFGLMILSGECEILTIAVDENWRRQNVGTIMVQNMIEIARRKACGKIFLEVDLTNQGAIALYRKFGFVDEYVRKKYYGENDAIVMALKLL